jgi:general secretion pathway protein D
MRATTPIVRNFLLWVSAACQASESWRKTFWSFVAVGIGLARLPAWSQQITAVKAFEQAGQAVVQIQGEQLPRPAVSTWRTHYLVLDFRARLGVPGRQTRFGTPVTTYLRYGWFSSNPPRVRVVVTMRGKQPYQLEPIAGGWQVRIGNPPSRAEETPPSVRTMRIDDCFPDADSPTTQADTTVSGPTKQTDQPSSPEKKGSSSKPAGSLGTRVAQSKDAPLPPVKRQSPRATDSGQTGRTGRTANTPPSAAQPTAQAVASLPPAATFEAPISLDFVGAEIGDVLKALAIQSGANIITAPDVKGSITISLNRVSVEEALHLITRLSGYRYERIGNTYVVGTAKSIETFKGSESSKEVPHTADIIPLKQAKAAEVASFLSARFPSLKVTPSSEKESNYLVVAGDAQAVAEAKEVVARFEQAIAAGEEVITEVYRVRFADARDLMRIVNQLVPSVSVSLGPGAMLSPTSSNSGLEGGSPTAGESPSATAQQMGAAMPAGTGASTAAGGQPPNLLVLMGTPREVQRALELLQKVDIKQPQVLIEARVMDISEASLRALGLSWSLFQSSRINTLDRTQPPPFPDSTTVTPNQQGIRFNKDGKLGIDFTIVKQPVDFSATLEALAQDQRNRLLANPRIATLDGRSARIFIGDEINYVKLIQQTQQGANVQTDSVQAGIILQVLPRVHEDRSITLQIKPEVSVITGFLSVPGGGSLPQLARRNAETTIRLNNGETLIIGGLIRESDIKTIQKVPVLGDLPFFGYLFRKTNTQRDRSEIVITLTVRVLE